jgi:multidrug efflux pump subunit AcrA (membrane-fusion protein)
MDAKVRQASDFINPANRTFKVEITVPEKDKSIKPNLTARLKINDYTNPEAILIPQGIISENANGEQYIYTISDKSGDKGKAIRTFITTGKTQGDNIEVLTGLKSSMEVVDKGARSVKDNQEVKIII